MVECKGTSTVCTIMQTNRWEIQQLSAKQKQTTGRCMGNVGIMVEHVVRIQSVICWELRFEFLTKHTNCPHAADPPKFLKLRLCTVHPACCILKTFSGLLLGLPRSSKPHRSTVCNIVFVPINFLVPHQHTPFQECVRMTM